jgi:hypothetical protein
MPSWTNRAAIVATTAIISASVIAILIWWWNLPRVVLLCATRKGQRRPRAIRLSRQRVRSARDNWSTSQDRRP